MRSLVCDALKGVWMLVTTPVTRLVADAVQDALERERRAQLEWTSGLVAAVTWTDRDDAALDDYTQESE